MLLLLKVEKDTYFGIIINMISKSEYHDNLINYITELKWTFTRSGSY